MNPFQIASWIAIVVLLIAGFSFYVVSRNAVNNVQELQNTLEYRENRIDQLEQQMLREAEIRRACQRENVELTNEYRELTNDYDELVTDTKDLHNASMAAVELLCNRATTLDSLYDVWLAYASPNDIPRLLEDAEFNIQVMNEACGAIE